jgi:hypothetical protein
MSERESRSPDMEEPSLCSWRSASWNYVLSRQDIDKTRCRRAGGRPDDALVLFSLTGPRRFELCREVPRPLSFCGTRAEIRTTGNFTACRGEDSEDASALAL